MENKIITKIQQLLILKDGYLLSPFSDYINSGTKLQWKCNSGHTFSKNWNKIQQGQWCPFCAGRYVTIEDIQNIAIQKNGKCLSKYYNKCIDKLLWECAAGHQWEASFNSIKNSGSWCPYCNDSIGEKICRKYFEFIFKKSFPKCKPNWLVNNDGYRLELDGFCSSLKIAFEYNGPHHYIRDCYKHTDLDKISANDNIKYELCKKNNVTLVSIPDVKSNSKQEYIKTYLINYLPMLGYNIPDDFKDLFISDTDLYTYNPLLDLQNIATSNKGKLLSTKYNGSNIKLQWECEFGHTWFATPSIIKNRNTWCPICKNPNKMNCDDIILHLSTIKDNENNIFNKRILSKAIDIIIQLNKSK